MTSTQASSAHAIRWRRWLAGVLALLLLMAGAMIWRVSVLTERGLARMASDLEELRASTQATPGRRPPLVGPATRGSAWPDYSAALAESLSIGDIHDDEAWEFVLSKHRATLERLALGAAREEGQFPYRWEQASPMNEPDLRACEGLLTLVRAKARVSREADAPAEAVSWLLRGCQFARDFGHNGTVFHAAKGSGSMGACLEDLAAIAQSGELDTDALLRLAGSLELLEAQLPTWLHGFRNEALLVGNALHDACTSDSLEAERWLRRAPADWRYLFSHALMVIEAWPAIRDLAQVVEESGDRPWPEARSLLIAKGEELLRSDNPLVRLWGPPTKRPGELLLLQSASIRKALAMTRLLRAAVVRRATGERLDLPDPFGDRLRWSPDGAPEKIWSVGPDAVDDGGRGDFVFVNTPHDLVLRVRP